MMTVIIVMLMVLKTIVIRTTTKQQHHNINAHYNNDPPPLTGEMLPDHVGFPMGEEHGGSTYYLMEMHYDNPNLETGELRPSGDSTVFMQEEDVAGR